MGNTWITNVQHFLNEHGDIGDLPGPALNLANHITMIIEEATFYNEYEPRMTTVKCRRRPQRRKCPGNIAACMDKDNPGRILWFCPVCDDNGIITGWESTIYNNLTHGEFN